MFAPKARSREIDEQAEEIRRLKRQIEDKQAEYEAELESLQAANRRLFDDNEKLREQLRSSSAVQENMKLQRRISSLKKKTKELNKLMDEEEDRRIDLL